MAYIDLDPIEYQSEEVKKSLGIYQFWVEYDTTSSPSVNIVTAVCKNTKTNEVRRATKTVSKNAELKSWKLEANDTTGDVYINIQNSGSGTDIPTLELDYYEDKWGENERYYPLMVRSKNYVSSTVLYATNTTGNNVALLASTEPFSNHYVHVYGVSGEGTWYAQEYTEDNRTVYVLRNAVNYGQVFFEPKTDALDELFTDANYRHTAWLMVYGKSTESGEYLLGRFRIDVDEAGGSGTGSDWNDPNDKGEPGTVLELNVIGALSGRHNDPLEDDSFSYIPTDKDTIKDYGCGGDGGNGGGGGGGASSIVVYKFVTERASKKEITTQAKRHGYGSGGGKGGKGGDGCIIIYY